MRKFKITDISIGITFIASILTDLIQQDLNWIFIQYFAVGSWFCISMVVHSVNRWFTRSGSKRAVFNNFIAGTIILFIIGIFFPPLTVLLPTVLLYVIPLIATYYVWICYHELHIKMRRPLSLLK